MSLEGWDRFRRSEGTAPLEDDPRLMYELPPRCAALRSIGCREHLCAIGVGQLFDIHV